MDLKQAKKKSRQSRQSRENHGECARIFDMH